MPKKNENNSSKFLRDWIGKGEVRPRLQSLKKSTIKHDKWDTQDYERLLKEKELLDLAAAEDRITDSIETGGSLFADGYYTLSKAAPKVEDEGEVRPSHLINRRVMEESMELAEFDALREYSVGDEIGAALALIAMEPEYETLWDRLKNERKLAEQLTKQEQALEQQEKTVEELMKELEGLDPEDESWQEAQQNYQDDQDLLNQLRQQLAEGAAALSEQLDQDGPMIKNRVRSIVKKGLEEVGNAEASAQAWGLERGQLIRMDAATRLELANRLKNPRLKHIAELIGPMQRLAFAEQLRKTTHARDEVYDLSQGNDLERVLPLELMGIRHPLMRLDFYKRYINDELVQYELRGQERVAKGGIIVCEDGSGSMSGEPEMWAKAVSICCLQIAKAQDRSFYGIHFGSPGEIYCKDFRDPRNVTFEDVLDWAEVFFNGGTDFMTPLSKALEILQEEFQEKGAVSGDILFITDGACGVPEEWLQLFKEEQKRIGFRVFGCVIGGSRMSEPLRTICDGRVLTVADLKSGNDMRDIFREL